MSSSEQQAMRSGEILTELQAVLRSRRADPPEGSYSAALVVDPERASRKIIEEAYELCVELTRPEPEPQRVASEAADVLFHVVTGLVAAGVDVEAALDELARRRAAGRAADTKAGA